MEITFDRIETLRDRIRESDVISDADRDALIEFSAEMEFRDADYGNPRHLKLLQHCTMLAGDSQKYSPDELPDATLTDALDDTDSAKDLVRWVNRTYDSEETKRDFRVAIRMFGEHATPGEGKPESIEQISADTSNDYNPMPSPSKMLRWDEHIVPMIERGGHARERAAIAVSWDLGARPFEFTALTVGDITDSKYGMKISVDGKRGQRSPTIITSVPHLKQWLAVHPAPDDADAPLWCQRNSPEDVSHQMKLKMLKKPARRAGIDHTDITYRRMRKSSASHLASRGVNQAHIEDHHGWQRGSDVAARYIAVFADANDRAIAAAHGVDVSADEPDPIGPVECPRCGEETPRERDMCVWCHQALSPEAVERVREQDQAVTRAAAHESGDRAEALANLAAVLDEHPELRQMVD